MSLLWVFLGGGLGALLRFGFANSSYLGGIYATLASNIVGSSLFAFVYAYLQQHSGNSSLQTKAFLLVGFCGAFTTFSTYVFELFMQLQNKDFLAASLLFLGNNILSFMAFAASYFLYMRFFHVG